MIHKIFSLYSSFCWLKYFTLIKCNIFTKAFNVKVDLKREVNKEQKIRTQQFKRKYHGGDNECRQTKSVLKNFLQSVNFAKFSSKNLSRDQSQLFKRSPVIGPQINV